MKRMLRWILVVCLAFMTLGQTVKAQDKKKVMTTFYPVYYLVEQIAGDKVEVSMLLEGGQGAHGYESTAQDAVKVQEADMFVYLDDEMEYFVSDLLELIHQEKTLVVETTKNLDLLAGSNQADSEEHEGHEHEDHEHEEHEHEEHEHEDHQHEHSHDYDPHTWLDPMFYAKQAENVKEALIELDPENKEIYEENTKALVEKLSVLDQEFRSNLETLENRTFVVQHAAFGYLAHAYDLSQVAITGLNSTQEPSAKVIAEMQQFMKDQGSKVIYVDPTMSEDISNTVASVTQAELLPLRTLEIVSQEEIEQGLDYFSMMRDNLQELLKNK